MRLPLATVLITLATPILAQHYGSLWCHQGGELDYEPAQCEPETLECFRFLCSEIKYGKAIEFSARGCGVSLTRTATGLANESCHQALGECQRLGGKGDCFTCSDKHMCNYAAMFQSTVTIILSIVLLSFLV